jgi:Rieske Fe-S protein
MRLERSHIDRREFLDGLIIAGAVGISAVTGETMLGYLTGIQVPEPEFIIVEGEALQALARQRYVLVPYGPQPVLILQLPGGELRAFSAVCTHGQCNVRYRPDRGDIFCGCHEGRFTVDGVNVPGTPPPAPLRRFHLQQRDDGSLRVQAQTFEADHITETAADS